jgi:hypothetical protein
MAAMFLIFIDFYIACQLAGNVKLLVVFWRISRSLCFKEVRAITALFNVVYFGK